MMSQINATHPQRTKRGKHDEVGAKDHAEAAAHQEQAAAAPKADQEGMESVVKQRQ
jgi:hypothetical protein